jgi:hypothetical protein
VTKSSKARTTRKIEKKRRPMRSGLVPGTPTKADHEQLIRVYSFFFGISGALEGNPDLLGRAQGIARGVLDELTGRYQALYGEQATEELFSAISSEFQPVEEKKPDAPKAKAKSRSKKPKAS